MSKLTGKITEFLGQWTNDRDTEAKGRAEKEGHDEPGEQTVEQEKEQVRRDHGDVSR